MESLFNKLMEENESDTSDFMTPQSAAWKLLTDDFDDDLSTAVLGFSPDSTTEEDPASFSFEMLLTICMEMLSHIAVIMKVNDDTVIDEGEIITLREKDFKFEEYFSQIKKILEKGSILFSFKKFGDNDSDHFIKKILDERYCRIVFRYNKKDLIYFDKNDVPDDVQYHFILNESYTPKKDLREIYAVIAQKDIMYKLSFNKVARIASTRCM